MIHGFVNGHHGWSSDETYAVHFRDLAGEHWYALQYIVRQARDRADAVERIARVLRHELDRRAEQAVNPDTVLGEVLWTALAKINWTELAENFYERFYKEA